MIDDTHMDGREIADLLPWYATGRLTGYDRHRVAIALAADPALQQELALILEEQTAAIEANEALGTPSRAVSDRFFAALEAQPAAQKRRFDVAHWIGVKVSAWPSSALAWGAVAALLLLVVQASVIGALIGGHSSGYTVASLDHTADGRDAPILLVSFAPTASIAAVAQLLDANAASLVAGPLPGDLYRIRVGDHRLTDKEIAAVVARLKAQAAVVRFVAAQAAPE